MNKLGSLAVMIATVLVCGCARNAPLPDDARANATGVFPTFDAVPPSAAPQLTDAQAASDIDRLEARGNAALSRTGRPPNDTGDLRRIRATHEDETLAQIEGGSV